MLSDEARVGDSVVDWTDGPGATIDPGIVLFREE